MDKAEEADKAEAGERERKRRRVKEENAIEQIQQGYKRQEQRQRERAIKEANIDKVLGNKYQF